MYICVVMGQEKKEKCLYPLSKIQWALRKKNRNKTALVSDQMKLDINETN